MKSVCLYLAYKVKDKIFMDMMVQQNIKKIFKDEDHDESYKK